MPRIPRGQIAGHTYHIINRGNGGATVFHKDNDYQAFLDLLAVAKSKYPMKVLGFCLMPNHFHFVLQPLTANALSSFMQWWLTTHVRRYHRHYQSSGHVWQGRFKSFPIQQDEHLLTVLRYIFLNPVRARLVKRADQWPWSSIRQFQMVDPWPVAAPSDWTRWLEESRAEPDLARIRTCVNRQAPFGSSDWQVMIAKALGLESTFRNRGRPRKASKK